MARGAGQKRKKLPKELAVVYADNCTGCEACIEVCPVDCIYKVPGEDMPSVQYFVDIDLERCIGCALCERWCPWDAIEMVPTLRIGEATAVKGGPPSYVEKNQEHLNRIAFQLADIYKEQITPAKKTEPSVAAPKS
jgi:Na+-translocating ferredoxin:NAD+ oxidoreductase subunit B